MKFRFIAFFFAFTVSFLFFSTAAQAQKVQSVGSVTYSTDDPSVYVLRQPQGVQGYSVFSVDDVLFEFTYLNRNLTIYRNGVATQTLPESVHHFFSVNQFFQAKGKYYFLTEEHDTLFVLQLNISSGKIALKTSVPDFSSDDLIGDYFVGYKPSEHLKAKQLYGVNVNTLRVEKLTDLSKVVPAGNGIGDLFDFGDGQNILMLIGRYGDERFDYKPSHYLMYNVVTKQIKDIGKQVAMLGMSGKVHGFPDQFSHLFGGVPVEPATKGGLHFLIDANMTVQTDSVLFTYSMDSYGYDEVGWVYEHGTVTGLLGRKSGDGFVKVKAAALPIVQMNDLVLKIFFDRPFIAADLDGLSPYALAMLKNGLHAKYGIAIKDPYWKTFFADDYREAEKLSVNGKKNIALIDQRLQGK